MTARPDAPRRRRLLVWAAVTAAGLLPLVWLWPAPGTSDVDNWRAWIANARAIGAVRGYAANNADYPPGAALALAAAASVGTAAGATTLSSIKLLTTAFLVATAALVGAWSRRPALALFTQLSLVTSAVGLVYLDVLVAPFVVGGLWAASAGSVVPTVSLIAAAVFMKWQPLLMAPFLAIHVQARLRLLTPEARRRQRNLLLGLVIAGIAGVLLIYGWQAVLALVRAGRHGALSNNAANLPWMLGGILRWWAPDVHGALWQGEIVDITQGPAWLRAVLRVASLAGFAAALLLYLRARDASAAALARYSLAGSLAYFLIHPGAHENHLFLSAVLAIGLAILDRRWLTASVVVNALALANLVAFYGFRGSGARFAVGADVTIWLAAMTCLAGGWLLATLLAPDPGAAGRASPRARRRTAPTGTDSAVP
jgi:hypothetical protein